MRLTYYPGPRVEIGLVMKYRKQGQGHWEVFDLSKIYRIGKFERAASY